MSVEGQYRITIHDVAAAAGVSRGTVSRVLNGNAYVSQSARDAVEHAIRETGYVPSTAARSLVRRQTGVIGFLVHEPHAQFLDDPNIGAILLGANEIISAADMQLVVLIVDSERDAARVSDFLSGGSVDGAILISTRSEDSLVGTIRHLNLPAVTVCRPPEEMEISYVSIDDRDAAYSITQRLQATRRHTIGMIACALDRVSGAERLAGFQEAMGERFNPGLVVQREWYSFQCGADGMAELLEREPDIDGVFAASDAVAAGALDTLRSHGLQVPRDVGLVGFDDSDWAMRCQPPLSTVRQPAELIGKTAAEQVMRLINNPDLGPIGVALPTSIVWRGSA